MFLQVFWDIMTAQEVQNYNGLLLTFILWTNKSHFIIITDFAMR